MAEKVNLIPAAELPLAETEEIDVLCVENGKMKRKAGANLGAKSWNDLKDKPFYEEEEVITLIDNQPIIEDGNHIVESGSQTFTVNETYIVKWFDEEYVVKSIEPAEIPIPGVLMVKNDVFEIIDFGDGLVINAKNGIMPETLTIKHLKTTVKPLDEKYLPDYDAVVELDATEGNWNYTLVKGDYNSLLDKFESGKLPKIFYKRNDGNITLANIVSIKHIASANMLDCRTLDDAFAIFSDNRIESP